jgi:hypothetical protein
MIRRFGPMLALALATALPGAARAGDQTFGGYECPTDCRGHQRGYRWAEEQRVSGPADCRVGSRDFIEGCNVYLEDPLRGADLDDAGAPIDW